MPEGFDSDDVVKTAYYRYNMSLGVGLNKVAGKVFRIGHLGALNEIMVGGALFAVEMALKDCRHHVKLGSGTAPPPDASARPRRSRPTGATPKQAKAA